MASSQSGISNAAFQEALQRAKQLAAKITQQAGKRPAEDPESPEPKRFAPVSVSVSVSDPIGAQLAAMKQQTPTIVTKASKNQVYVHGIVINGEKTLDVMIPGSKVGYVIGKGGEMIRNLQERAGVKMVVFQETNEATQHEKQLRIIGDPEKVDYARQLVTDLLTEKEIETIKMKNVVKTTTNEYGSVRANTVEVPVSPQFIGLVIGKGGETIRRIQQESQAKVQFDTTKSDSNGNKICIISGPPEYVNKAVNMVNEIIEMATTGRKPLREGEYTRMPVPAYKCGIVIGRGGETIRQIKQQAGCDIELDKDGPNDNPNEKYFIIRGPPEKISLAQQLILDRINGTTTSTTSVQNTTGMTYNELQQWKTYWQSEASQSSDDSKSQDANAAAWAAYYAQYYAQAQSLQSTSNNNSSGDNPTSQTSDQQPQQQQQQPQQQPQQQMSAEYAKQWADYYRAYGMHKEAEMLEQMMKQQNSADDKPSSDNTSSNSSYVGHSQQVTYPGYKYSNYSQNQQ